MNVLLAKVWISAERFTCVVLSTLLFLALQIEGRGGKCIPVQCDHSNDEDIEKLFKQIENEQDGRLDLLVNNAYSAVQVCTVILSMIGYHNHDATL